MSEPPDDDPRGAPGGAESWRSWLLSGSTGRVADPRRARGAHRGLKKVLIEGAPNGGPYPESWRQFSGAMVRLAIDDAMNSLPTEQTRVVWLAYFGGLSNKEIARQLDLSVTAVRRRLKQALAGIADRLERGRSVALGWVLMLLGLRRVGTHRVAAPLAVATGVAAVAGLAVPSDAPPTRHLPAGPPAATYSVQAQAPSQRHLVAPPAPARLTVPAARITVSVPGVPALGLPPLLKAPLPPLLQNAVSAILKKALV